MSASVEPISNVKRKLPVCLWQENPYGLVSWWDVKEFGARDLINATGVIESIKLAWTNVQRIASIDERKSMETALSAVETQLRDSGLLTSSEAVTEAREIIAPNKTQLSAASIVKAVESIKTTIRLEMKRILFLHVQPERVAGYRMPTQHWDDVVDRWPEMKGDISESSKCFALDRYAAASFHILLVAEFGVIQLCKLLQVAGDHPGWGCAEKLQDIHGKKFKDRSQLEQRHSLLIKNTVDLILSLKNYRHILMHVDNKVDWLARDIGPETATEIMSTARNLMRRLAKELPTVP